MKNISQIILLLLLFYSIKSFGQPGQVSGVKISNITSNNRLAETFYDYAIYELDSRQLVETVYNSPEAREINLVLGKEHNWTILLEQVQIISPGCFLHLATDRGEDLIPLVFDKAFKGTLKNNPNSEVRLIIDEGFLYGYLKTEAHTFYIEPFRYFADSNSQDLFVMYKERDVIPVSGLGCGLTDAKEKGRTISPENKNNPLVPSSAACRAIGLFIAADYSMYEKYNHSIADLLNQIIGVINNVNGNYDNEFNDEIQFLIGQFYISTCSSCDPWDGTANAVDLLNDFKNWGNSGGFCGANNGLHELWTNRNLFVVEDGMNNFGIIGIAKTPGACNSDAYHVLQDYTSSANLLRSLTTHEIGHNFNCPHNYQIDSNCDPPGRPALIMDPFNAGVNSWSNGTQSCAQNSIATVNNYTSGLSCLQACPGFIPEVWVDFSYTGCTQYGTFDFPFSVLQFGVYWVQTGGTIKIKSSSTSETPIINKACIIESFSPGAIIGQ